MANILVFSRFENNSTTPISIYYDSPNCRIVYYSPTEFGTMVYSGKPKGNAAVYNSSHCQLLCLNGKDCDGNDCFTDCSLDYNFGKITVLNTLASAQLSGNCTDGVRNGSLWFTQANDFTNFCISDDEGVPIYLTEGFGFVVYHYDTFLKISPPSKLFDVPSYCSCANNNKNGEEKISGKKGKIIDSIFKRLK
eukprot:TRINITY_DN2304_c0_g1_i1.p1 TRINITY_DN2304_c0_g1~~TRINITY_DN2304_c0_g1_i1.p1  ORF type:complete len:193 (-),score=25.48 TRINITY_DN2304_c0_g1_i1:99-677(-)